MDQLRVGVIGVGRQWRRRYRAAVRAIGKLLQVVGVCDVLRERCEHEAEKLGCLAASGPTQLIETGSLEALLIVDPGWYKLWPIELASRRGLPVFCAVPPDLDEHEAERLRAAVAQAKAPVIFELAPRLASVTNALRLLVAEVLGPLRWVGCTEVRTEEDPDNPALLGTGWLPLLDWCVNLVGAEPTTVRAMHAAGSGVTSLWLDTVAGRALQVQRRIVRAGRDTVRLEASAERGWASIELDKRLSWGTDMGIHRQWLKPGRTLVQTALEQFVQQVTMGAPSSGHFEEVYRMFGWLRAARQSLVSGQSVTCSGPPASEPRPPRA